MKVGGVVSVLALLLIAVSVTMLVVGERPRALFAWIASATLLVGTLFVWTGLGLLPTPDSQRDASGVTPTWLLLVPVLTAAWTMVHAASARAIRE